MKNYRTQEQFDEMMENCINGNRKDAGKIGAEGGFYAKDLVDMYDDELEEATGLVYLMEMIANARED